MQLQPIAYGIEQASKVLSVGKRRIWTLIAEGRIEARQLDGRILIPVDSLRAFIADLPFAAGTPSNVEQAFAKSMTSDVPQQPQHEKSQLGKKRGRPAKQSNGQHAGQPAE